MGEQVELASISGGTAGDRLRRTVYLISGVHPGWQRVRAALTRLPQLELIGESSEAEGAIADVSRDHPDVILVSDDESDAADVPLPVRIATACPAGRLLLIAAVLAPSWLQRLAGIDVHGYLLWPDVSPATLMQSVDLACIGLVPCSLVVSNRLTTGAAASAGVAPFSISPRERALLRGLRAGLTRDQLAIELGISPPTLKRTRRQLREKLGASTQYQLGAAAAEFDLH